ncbi:MAG: shikimate dehydrogenase [Bacteroidia bacterium]|nr:shikimate dehydrogenase [Bacteroidia bacterium]NND16646.1 shikimate dehydrogenase [Eudoraea sp.]
MANSEKNMHRFGLIGRNIAYSFSPGYFAKKFQQLGLEDHRYEIFDLEDISLFPELLVAEDPLSGLNVTIPYKEAIIPYLDVLSDEAEAIGAVNTICFRDGQTIGHNTDIQGFEDSIAHLMKGRHTKAMVLGSGGASKAVMYALQQMELLTTQVSRRKQEDMITYEELTTDMITSHPLLINCTPLGTYPNIDEKPAIPYEGITSDHLLYDLVYNPEKTAFLTEGELRGAITSNGLAMLEGQAEASWDLWDSYNS